MLSVRDCLVFLILFGFSATEDEIIPEAVTTTSKATESAANTEVTYDDTKNDVDNEIEGPVVLPDLTDASNAIWKACNCTEDVVDCSSRNLQPFEAPDWIGFRDLGITDITNVDLSGNVYLRLPQFPVLPIRKLNLSNSEIQFMEDATFSNLKYLTILDLSRNKMSFIIGKRVFSGVATEGIRPGPFMNLRHLNLAYNDIHSLTQNVFMFMPYLTFLDLSGNPLASIDQVTMGALAELMRLQELRVSECELETLPMGIFRRLRRLQRLDLSGNKFIIVPAALSEASNLQYLNFNRNSLQSISESTALSNLTRLQELHISRHSRLRSVAHGALGGLQSLIKLQMNYNPRLTELDPGFLEWEYDSGIHKRPSLEELYLNNNNLSGIDSRLLDHWNYLTRVDFTANPYTCNCSNQWMVDVLVPLIEGMKINSSTSKMICRRPYNLRGLTFAQLRESGSKLPCSVIESQSDGTGVETAVMYGILVGTLISFPLVLVIVILWKRGHFARCRKKMNSKGDYFDDEETDAF